MTDQWETRADPLTPRQTTHPAGWEPFAAGGGLMWLRRRVEAVAVAHGAGGDAGRTEAAACNPPGDRVLVQTRRRTTLDQEADQVPGLLAAAELAAKRSRW